MPKILKNITKVLSLILVFLFGFMSFEPAITDAATSVDVTVNQVVGAELSISATADAVTMDDTISGITGGSADGSKTMTVITNNTNGLSMKVKASSAPAMRLMSGETVLDSFADNAWASGSTPEYSFTVGADESAFGFTVESGDANDTVQTFKSLSNACNAPTGTRTADTCWAPFSTTDLTVINRASKTSESGIVETLKFKTESGSTRFQQQGTYTAIITVTVVVNA